MVITIPKSKSVLTNTTRSQSYGQKKSCPSFGVSLNVTNKTVLNKIMKMSDSFTSAHQRLFMGVTALVTQPIIDYKNKDVDGTTRKFACARTIAKICAGSLTGISIRWLCIKAADGFCKTIDTEKELAKKALEKNKTYIPKTTFTNRETLLLPKLSRKITLKEVKKYKNALGTTAATFIMIGTNFLIDAPLTTFFTNKLAKIIPTPKDNKTSATKGGN
ncbi:hypothetical protein KBA27_02560 [bacterium]|nr:hypothetical protein [bacterium]